MSEEIEDALSAALRVAGKVKNADGYDELASAISYRYARRGEYNRAVDIADTINDPYTMERTVGGIAVMLDAEGREADAFELVESLEDLSHQSTATAQIAIAHAVAGEFDRAVEIAKAMDDSAATLSEIVTHVAAKGEYERALGIVDMIDFPLYATWARIRLAESHSQAGRHQEALELLSQALDEAAAIEPENEKAAALSEIAVRFSGAGQVEKSGVILSQALAVARGADVVYKDAAISQVAVANARLKRFDEAVTITEMIDNVYHITTTLIELAVFEYEEEVRRPDAIQLLSDAYDLIVEDVPETQRDEDQHNSLLVRIAVYFVDFEQHDQALKAAQSIGSQDEKQQALENVAVRYAQAGKYEEARESARTMDDDAARAGALLRVSRIAIGAGAMEVGIEILPQARSLIEKVEPPLDRVRILTELAIAYTEAGQGEQMGLFFTEALNETKSITGEYQKAAALLAIADAAAKTGHEMDEESKEMLWQISVV